MKIEDAAVVYRQLPVQSNRAKEDLGSAGNLHNESGEMTSTDQITKLANTEEQKQRRTEMRTIEHGSSAEDSAFNETGTLDVKKQSQSANMNLISYQTASFGQNVQTLKNQQSIERAKDEPIEEDTSNVDGENEDQKSKEQEASQNNPSQQMFASMSDLNFIAAAAAQSSSTKFQSIQSNAVNKAEPQPIEEEEQ